MMIAMPMLGPVLALIGWTLVMLVWTIVSVTKGAKTAKIKGKLPNSIRARDVEGMMDEKFSYPRRNYEHLVEQPTLFYALALALALMGASGPIPVGLAWAYVVFRVWHSIAQATGRHRGPAFGLSSLSLLILFVYAVVTYLG